MSIVNFDIRLIMGTSEILIVEQGQDNSSDIKYFSKEFKGKKYLTDPKIIYHSTDNTVWIGSRSDGLIKIDLAKKTFENAGA